MSLAIKVENLSKAYQIGEFSTGTISRDIERWWAGLRGKEDPFLKIGETNDRTTKGESNLVWSLKDLDFEINQGDAVGIIGRNGAGKSTLLKLLSRVTSPTTGSIKVKGRIASLLEVGTGFHPELTGRENIFLNGAILGMRKKEIKKRFDEIVDFAGIERYIDTPVKRYSSGMYVRLAFAVAAHLESEILIVDEVLAVGDAEFQRKCLGKMSEVSKGDGRTVLFVSHNMSTVSTLCSRSILLENGQIKINGFTEDVISEYAKHDVTLHGETNWEHNTAPGNEVVKLYAVRTINEQYKPSLLYKTSEAVGIELTYEVFQEGHILWHGINLYNQEGINLFDSHSTTSSYYHEIHPTGVFKMTVWIPGNLLNEGNITAHAAIFNHLKHQIHLHVKNAVSFNVFDSPEEEFLIAKGHSTGKFPGVLRPVLQWKSNAINNL